MGRNKILKEKGFTKGQKESSEEFYRRVDRAEERLEKKYPNAKIFQGSAISLNALLKVYPEAIMGS